VQHELRLEAYDTISKRHMRWPSSGRQQRPSAGHSSMTTSTSWKRFLDHAPTEKLLQLVTTVLAVARRWRLLLPRGGPGSPFCDPGDSLGSVIFQETLSPRYRDVREKAVISNQHLVNISAGC